MIEIFEGRLGGGKTFSAVRRILVAWCKGQHVYHNLPIVWDECVKLCEKRRGLRINEALNHYLATDDDIRNFHERVTEGTPEKHVLCVLDECHEQFNARDWAAANRRMLSFLTHSRHYHVDVVFISQSLLNIDKQFARLVQYIWRFRDLDKYRIPGLGIKWPTKHLVAACYDYDGRTLLRREWQSRDIAIFKCYDSHAKLSHLEVKQRLETLDPIKIEKPKKKVNKFFLLLAVLGLGCGGWAMWPKGKSQEGSAWPALEQLGARKQATTHGVDVYQAVIETLWPGHEAVIGGERFTMSDWTPYGVVRSINASGVELMRDRQIVFIRRREESSAELHARFPGLENPSKSAPKDQKQGGSPSAQRSASAL